MNGGDEVLLAETVHGVRRLTLNRPEAMNALNLELKAALSAEFLAAASDDQVRAVLISSNGRAFCAGGDLTEMDPSRPPEDARLRQAKLLGEVFLPLARLPKPTVAAVNGHAHGAGLSLALSCDLVVADAEAAMSFGYVHRGLTPDCCISYILPRLVGLARAKELLFTGRRFTGGDAENYGLITQAVDGSELAKTSTELAETLAQGATIALALAKRMLDQASHLSMEDLADVEAYSQAISRSTQDHREAIAAFREKRPAMFVGA